MFARFFAHNRWQLRSEASLNSDQITVLRKFYLFYLFIYYKGPESATDMPMIVNSKLTHYKIRQISTENKRLKNRQTAKMV